MKKYKDLLSKNNIAPSFQRIKILEYLDKNRTHPTADMVYQALKKMIPTLSKTTVYNTLKKLSQSNIIAELHLFENEIRYEYNTDPHIHFKCLKCGKIYDLDESYDHYENNFIDGHKVIEHHVNLKGICRNCLEK